MITTQKALRAAFWDQYPEFREHFGKVQNQCPADVRMVWVDFVDFMASIGEISEALAQRATL